MAEDTRVRLDNAIEAFKRLKSIGRLPLAEARKKMEALQEAARLESERLKRAAG